MDKNGIRYDPYYLLHHGGADDLVQNAREIANAIIPLPVNVREPYWIESAQNVLTAAILYYFDLELSFTETIMTIQTTPPEEMIDEIYESKNITAKMYVNSLRNGDTKTISGIATELSHKIMVFAADPLIRAAMGDSKTDSAVVFHRGYAETHSIFLKIPEDSIEQWADVTKLIINQLFRTLERRADKGKDKQKVRPILVLLDEVARFGKLESIKSALATLRSKSVTMCLIVQSLGQFEEVYGKYARSSIMDNFAYTAILRVTDANNQKYFSELVGTCEVEKESYGKNYAPETGLEVGSNSHWGKHREPIIFSHEFAQPDKHIVLMTPEGFCRVDKIYAPRPDELLTVETVDKSPSEPTGSDSVFYKIMTYIFIGLVVGAVLAWIVNRFFE